MNELHIYPTSRALRHVSQMCRTQEGFLPTLMRMDEFEKRAVLLEDKIQIDPLQRIFLLREAANFEAFKALNLDLELVKFFTKSDAIFKFFEEMTSERIDFSTLVEADAYAEFGEHLAILEQLFQNYQIALEKKGFTDKAFMPSTYRLHDGFLNNYQTIEIHLEGYLSRFELELLSKIAQQQELIIHYTTSPLNQKMQERFSALGIFLPQDAHVTFSLSSQALLNAVKNEANINATVYAVEERQEQIAVAFTEIEKMVLSGIAPDDIVLILPDEDFKEHLMLFDRYNNLNFAMGYDYTKRALYKSLEALYRYWQTFDESMKVILSAYGLDMDRVQVFSPYEVVTLSVFFNILEGLKLLDFSLKEGGELSQKQEESYEKYRAFVRLFPKEQFSLKEWLYIWMKSLAEIAIDDVRGGLVTVMGVLETRGVSFKGVVIVDFNEGVVPATSSKDQFLNSSVRTFAKLPTKQDREALQKQYYKRLLEQAEEAVIIYSKSDSKLPSKFLYELNLTESKSVQAPYGLLYDQSSQLISEKDPIVDHFDAKEIVWSPSQLKTYLTCRRKYYYRYIQNIKSKKEKELNEGKFLHDLLEQLFKKQDHFKTVQEMDKEMVLLWDKMLPLEDVKLTYKKLLWREKLRGFIASQIAHFQADWRVKETEVNVSGDIGGLHFKGRVDRIDYNGDEILVLDYKSGSIQEAQKTRNLETLTDFQMSIYHHLLTPHYPNIKLAFVKILEEGQMEEITSLEEKNAFLAEHIIALKQTKSFVAEKCASVQNCVYCEFALMCERGEYL
ncbi:MAG: hypothetical protein RL113_892 [Pseudomonadota bacterium]